MLYYIRDEGWDSERSRPKKVIPKKSFIGSNDGYYLVKIQCSNCGYEGVVYVEKRLHLNFAYCPDCECSHCLSLKEKLKQPKSKKTKESLDQEL